MGVRTAGWADGGSGSDRSPSKPAPPADHLGRRLGDFVLEEKLAEGGFGAIYLAQQVELARQVVVKILQDQRASEERERLRFLREARLASTLDHPYAAHIYAFGVEPDGVSWIAMELVRGTPLSELLRAGAMPLRDFVPFLDRLCEVVHTAHEHGIVHRDIKPQNVMVIARAGALLPKLLDLGIAKDALLGSNELDVSAARAWEERNARRSPPRARRSGSAGADGADAASWATLSATSWAPTSGLSGSPGSVGQGGGGGASVDLTRGGGGGGAGGCGGVGGAETTTGVAQKSETRAAKSLAENAGTGATLGASATSGSLTGEGDWVGSPAYMAPEQWMSAESVDRRCDVYALGVLSYEAVGGRTPFSGTLQELAEQHLRAAVPPLPVGLPGELHAVIVRAMAKEPEGRFESALELARAFRTASGLGVDGMELPRLAREVAEIALRDYPQPIAEAVAELGAARSVWRALDAAARLTRASLRLLTVIALAACWVHRGERPLTPAAIELLSALRKRRLEDEEWLELLRALIAPFVANEREHPVPELVGLLHSPAAAMLASLVARRAAHGVGPSATEQAATEELCVALAQTSEWLRALSFLSDYLLAVVGADDQVELWTGALRKHRVTRALPAGMHLEPDVPMLLGKDGRALVLAPLAMASRPSPNAEPELFLLEGRGRRGVLLLALPGGFKQTSEAALTWLDRMSAVSDDAESSLPTLEAPYRGLSPFTAADAAVFFGREREVERFLNRLRTEPLLVVVGPSGAGKSSFVRAGVVPSLEESFHAVVFRPGATPLATLRTKLAHLGVATDDLNREADAGEVAARVYASALARGETFVFVVDQFEETFTLAHDRNERAVFCAWLARIAASAPDPVRVVLTLRDDFLARLQQETAFEERLGYTLELLATPGAAALSRILVEPAKLAGFAFESDALVGEMVRAVEARPGALALLSFAASKLWERRDVERRTLTSAAYVAMGGVAGALAQHGENVLELMTPKQRLLVREVFRRLVTAEGTGATTRHDQLLAIMGGDPAARAVIERLVAARLLVVAEGDEGTELVEVIHEALLSAWPRLVEWQREDAAGNRLRDQISAAAQQWEARGRPRGSLWRDELVEDYRRWRLQHSGGLTSSEEAFGKASLAERNRWRRLRAAVGAVLAMAAVVTSYVAWQQTLARKAAQQATVEARQATDEAKQANHHAEQSASRARDAARLAAARLHTEDPTTQLALLRDLEESVPLPDWAPEARAALHAGVASVVQVPHTGPVRSIAFSPDGRRIVSSSQDKTIAVWNADGTGQPLILRGHTASVNGVAFSPDGRHIASASADKTVRVWDADGSGEPLIFAGHTRSVYGISYSPDGSRIASASRDKSVRIWHADGSGNPLVLLGHTEGVNAVSFSPDGSRVASASDDKTIRVWNANGSGKPLVLRGRLPVAAVSFSPDGGRIASCSADRAVRVWNADGSGIPLVIPVPSIVSRVAFSPDGRHIAAASTDHAIRILNADGSGEPRVLRGHADGVQTVAFSRDSRRVVSGDERGMVRVWMADIPEDPLVLHGIAHGVSRISVRSDGRLVTFISDSPDDQTVQVLRTDGSGESLVLRGNAGSVFGVSFSPDGHRIAASYADRTVRVWNADGSGVPIVLRGHTDGMADVSFSPDSRRIASSSDDKTVRLWNADGSGEPVVLQGHSSLAVNVSFSPEGRRVVSASLDRTVRVWNADGSGEPLVLRANDDSVVMDASFSPDGEHIVSAYHDGTVRIWNADGSGEPLVFRGHSATAWSASFSPDGRRVASASGDKTIRIWNADGSGEPVVLHGHTESVNAVAFSADGRLFSGSSDKTIRIWSDLAPLLPTDPRLWQATSYCLSIDSLKELIGIDAEEVARAIRDRCLERVAAARAPMQ
jgi:WD40 repeat protein/serine/threonine protein kinase